MLCSAVIQRVWKIHLKKKKRTQFSVTATGLCNEDHIGLHLSKKVRHMLRRPASPAALVPLWTCVAAAELTSLPAWGQLESRSYGQRPPWKALIDWSLIFLIGWHSATKLWNGTADWEGLGKEGGRAFIWQRETRHKCKRKREKNVSAHVCQMIQITVVILDWSLDPQGKKKYSECVGMSAQVKMKAVQWEGSRENILSNYIYFQ